MADVDVISSSAGSPALQNGSIHSGRPISPQSAKQITMSAQASTAGSRPSTAFADLTDAGGSPVSEYLKPIINAANRRWKQEQEGRMMGEIIRIKFEKKEANRAMKQKAQEIARKIPIELLGRDWLVMKRSTIETRAYLVENILPLVVLGVEKLLMEVDARGLVDTDEPDANFNPINFLAQFLLRNNPKYSNFSEASPYMRSLRKVSEELKGEILTYDDSRLARLKADARRKRDEFEMEEKRRAIERARRLNLLTGQFSEWGVGTVGKVEIALVVTSLRSFAEITEHYPEELRASAKFTVPDLHPDEVNNLLTIQQFCDFILINTDSLSSEIFDQLVEHLTKCAWAYQGAGEAAVRRDMLIKLFHEVDRGNVGLLDRHRILALFEQFYDGAPANIVRTLRNPRRWPVVQLDEEVSSDEEEEDDDVMPKKKKRKTPVQKKSDESEEMKPDEEKGEGEIAADGETTEQPTEVDGEAAKVSGEAAEGTLEEVEGEEPKAEAGVDAETTDVEEAVTETVEEPAGDATETAEETADETAGEVTETAEDTAGEVTETAEETAGEATETAEETATEAEKTEGEETSGEDVTETAPEESAGESAPEAPEEPRSDSVNEETGETEQAGGEEPTQEPDEEKDTAETAEAVEKEGAKEAEEKFEGPGTATTRVETVNESTSGGVSFAEGTVYRETTQMSLLSRSQSAATAFDEDTLNESQFVQTTETFLGEVVSPVAFQRLVAFISEGYVETEEERRQRMLKVLMEQRRIQRKLMADNLFDKWDNDGSGYLEFTEVDPVVLQYKGGMEQEALKKAKKKVKAAQKHPDGRMTKKEFRFFLTALADQIPGDDAYEYLVEFLLATVVRSYQERVRGEARKKWLAAIRNSAITSAASMEPVFRAVFQALFKDAETHGGGKHISAYISMLEKNDVKPSRGPLLLRYVASTPTDAPFLVGQILYQDMKGISFAAVEGGKPIHVPRVQQHGNVHIFNPDHTENRDGAFIVVPLKDRVNRVFGLLGVDTMGDSETKEIFITHEIQFYQGVAKAFSTAYHFVDIKHKTLMVAESAVAWLHRRCINCCEITFYMVENETVKKKKDFCLRKMLVTDEKGMPKPFENPPRLRRVDNLFRDYLFKCVDTSDSVSSDAYGERHLAFPIRDKDGMAVCVLDISIGKIKQLSSPENKEMTKMLRLLQMAYQEIVRQSEEGSALDAQDVSVMFDKLMLEDLKENVRRLDAQAYGELKSYHNPPNVIRLIIRAVLSIFYPNKAIEGALKDWGPCKQLVGVHLGNMVMEYDPTAEESIVPPADILAMLDEVPHGEVSKVGSKPAEHLYNWVFVCLSLLEHTRKMKVIRGIDTKSTAGSSPRDGNRSVKDEPQTDIKEIADELKQELEGEKSQPMAETTELNAETTEPNAENIEPKPRNDEAAPETQEQTDAETNITEG